VQMHPSLARSSFPCQTGNLLWGSPVRSIGNESTVQGGLQAVLRKPRNAPRVAIIAVLLTYALLYLAGHWSRH